MKPGIHINKIWFDEDLVELKIDSADDVSSFSTTVYIGHPAIREAVDRLNVFKNQIHGGICDLDFGAFGPEYANGAFHARLHFQERGKIHVSIRAQSEFKTFGMKSVASEAALYFISEPALLDNFIAGLAALVAGSGSEATLDGL